MSPGGLHAHYTERALRTVRLVRILDDADLQLRPTEASMSAGEIISHICGSSAVTRSVIADEVPGVDGFKQTFDVGSVAGAVGSLAGCLRNVQEALAAKPDRELEQVITPFGPDMPGTRREFVYMLIEHEVHHFGQLHVYARLAGKVPPVYYHPVDESVLEV